MISIIIPTLNERARLARLLDALDREQTPHEVIVVDGGSDDGTAQEARRRGALVLKSDPGRGRQLALGARAAVGHVLLFLHADCVFPPGGWTASTPCFTSTLRWSAGISGSSSTATRDLRAG